MELSLETKEIEMKGVVPNNFPKYRLLNEAAHKVIKLLRPDLLSESLGVLFEEYDGDLKKILAEYIN